MSFRLMQKVWNIDLSPRQKLLLLRLAFYANDDGSDAYPSVETLSTACNLTRRGVQKIIRQLEKNGILELQGSAKGGRGRTRQYRIVLERANSVRSLKGEPSSLFRPKRANQRAQKGELGSPELSRTIDTLSQSTVPDPFDEFWAVYPSRHPHPNPKAPARQKFEAALKKGVPAADIIRGARNYAAYAAQRIKEPQYIAQAVTWLNQERWAEHQDEPEPTKPATGWQVAL